MSGWTTHLSFASVMQQLKQRPRTWLITGVAGFIGSNLLQFLLETDQNVIGLDNFSTGSQANLSDVKKIVGAEKFAKFKFIEGDIRDSKSVSLALQGVEIVLHQAALGSVPRSVQDPLTTNLVNNDGFLNVLNACKEQAIKRIVFASSSSVYGADANLPKLEDRLGAVLSPYAASKRANELYAEAFCNVYNLELIGLRYFNVFGPRQSPQGEYAAVIPRWINALMAGKQGSINGDGETSRDFCYVDNVVQANLIAALNTKAEAINQFYNIACSERTSLNELYSIIATCLNIKANPTYLQFRPGDVKHSLADINKAKNLLGYQPLVLLEQGMRLTLEWFKKQ